MKCRTWPYLVVCIHTTKWPYLVVRAHMQLNDRIWSYAHIKTYIWSYARIQLNDHIWSYAPIQLNDRIWSYACIQLNERIWSYAYIQLTDQINVFIQTIKWSCLVARIHTNYQMTIFGHMHTIQLNDCIWSYACIQPMHRIYASMLTNSTDWIQYTTDKLCQYSQTVLSQVTWYILVHHSFCSIATITIWEKGVSLFLHIAICII